MIPEQSIPYTCLAPACQTMIPSQDENARHFGSAKRR
jgi:hypothetical protein